VAEETEVGALVGVGVEAEVEAGVVVVVKVETEEGDETPVRRSTEEWRKHFQHAHSQDWEQEEAGLTLALDLALVLMRLGQCSNLPGINITTIGRACSRRNKDLSGCRSRMMRAWLGYWIEQ